MEVEQLAHQEDGERKVLGLVGPGNNGGDGLIAALRLHQAGHRVWISRRASWKAITPEAQAATWVMTGPVRPYFIETWAAPMEPDTAGMANGSAEAINAAPARNAPPGNQPR